MTELESYVLDFYGNLMTPAEAAAYTNLLRLEKARAYDSPNAWEFTRKRLSTDPEVLSLMADGPEAFYRRTTDRILREHPDEAFLNLCPRCGALARTPKAKQCPKCFFSWRHQETVEPKAP